MRYEIKILGIKSKLHFLGVGKSLLCSKRSLRAHCVGGVRMYRQAKPRAVREPRGRARRHLTLPAGEVTCVWVAAGEGQSARSSGAGRVAQILVRCYGRSTEGLKRRLRQGRQHTQLTSCTLALWGRSAHTTAFAPPKDVAYPVGPAYTLTY